MSIKISILRFALIALCLTLFSNLNPLEVAAQEKSDEISEAVKAWLAGFDENDFAKFVELYETSDTTLIVNADGSVWTGTAQVKSEQKKVFEIIEFSNSKADSLLTRIDGDFGWSSFKFDGNLKHKKSGAKLRMRNITTLMFKKIDGKWKIVHEHSSIIEGVPRLERIGN